ncbi:M14 family metallopeptidase [Cytophaga sp. FL35]|uniref:M14 family metallopeptidase n=1 Tax=Cytophaga sp. FL35 TaxID=1904456 RepID=UPI001653E4D0|nr:M14 family metallopeptidase [Cytophaga sp. FL35]MBC6998267.1 zinc carboxypeptidase [Cytophaga sp. FL35]
MKSLISLLLVLSCYSIQSQQNVDLSYYLPDSITYNPKIPTPKQIIGHEVGQWHVTHDKLEQYMRALAKSSERILLEERGKTFEGRPLLLLTVTSPTNHGQLEGIRQEHLKLSDSNRNSISVDGMPVVVYQGFSIHGNEPSGSNAALAYAYYLAAAEGPEIEDILQNSVILLDPCFNPDGLQRFAHWANSNKNLQPNPDSNDREFHEAWPGGRTNHYWFDMNRDWLPVQLPESRARIETYHRWMPNILTDHHEMGTNSTFFFQPGEPTRVHPLTPKENQSLTAEIGNFHARALEKIGSLYYSEENYDDYYYGKGSTFPDINGGIGILFEQGSSRGHLQESENGLLTFPFTIRNQMTTAISTIEAATELRPKILKYQQQFFKEVGLESVIGRSRAIVFGDSKDAAKTRHLAEILHRHKIKFHHLRNDFRYNGMDFKKGASFMVPYSQKNHRLIKAMFEKRTSFTDSIFYDISAWTFPLAFNMDYADIRSLQNMGEEITELHEPKGKMKGNGDYAYLFEWNEYYTPKALNQILKKGIRAKVAKKKFSLENKNYGYGTIMVPIQNQNLPAESVRQILSQTAQDCGIEITAVSTGLTQGIDLGSNDFEPVKKQRVGILTGNGVRSYDAGEIWHLFDTRYQMKLSKLDVAYLSRIDLNRYTDIIVPSIASNTLGNSNIKKLKDWVQDGGTLITYRSAVEFFASKKFIDLQFKKDTLIAKNVSFEQKQNFTGAQVTGGAIFEAQLDLSHPIAFGYKNKTLPLFRNTNIYIVPDKNSYNNPIKYTEDPLLSGYISEENLELIKNSVPFQVQHLGRGRVIAFTDNTNFRAFWYGTNKLLMNAIFFGNLM